ncbi:MAG: hypothetical protein SFY92_07695 [Verrucomicrobiae bacterium]|nr:hypothetical protein [Verrucomicrobiae bacterium]
MNPIIRQIVRTKLRLTTRQQVNRQIGEMREAYRRLSEKFENGSGSRPVRVPPMRGVDEDMREWSYYMILEHNVIVNGVMTSIVAQLVAGREPVTPGVRDPKRDVMPSLCPGPEQVTRFDQSVEDHVALVAGLGPLRGTRRSPHPLFGAFDAHQWHGMFALHLQLHYRQAQRVYQLLPTVD